MEVGDCAQIRSRDCLNSSVPLELLKPPLRKTLLIRQSSSPAATLKTAQGTAVKSIEAIIGYPLPECRCPDACGLHRDWRWRS